MNDEFYFHFHLFTHHFILYLLTFCFFPLCLFSNCFLSSKYTASKVNPAKEHNRSELPPKETQQAQPKSRSAKWRPNYESNGMDDEISSGKKRNILRKKKAHFDSITNSPVNSDDALFTGSKISGDNLHKKRKLSTSKEVSNNATACDDSTLTVSCGTTSSSVASSPLTSHNPSNCTLDKFSSPIPSSSTNLKVHRDKSRPLTVSTNYETISSSKRRKEEIISRALVALQNQWRERFLQSQQTQQTNILNPSKSHHVSNVKYNNEYESKSEFTNQHGHSNSFNINGSFSSSGNFDSNHISSTSGNCSGSRINCNLPSNDSPGFSSTGASGSILRQPRLQVNQSTLNYIRGTHRNSLESSSRGSMSSESSISPSDSESESSFGSSSSEEEKGDSLSSSEDEDEDSPEKDHEDHESSCNDESDNSNISYESSPERKKRTKSLTNNFATSACGGNSRMRKSNDNSTSITTPKKAGTCNANANTNANRTSSNNFTKKLNDTSVSSLSSNVKKKKSPVKSIDKKVTGKSRNENGSKSKKKNPGTITCAICFTVKYYSHKQRRFGQFSCEPCSKFFASFLRSPRAYFCDYTGNVICFRFFLFFYCLLFISALYCFLFFHSVTHLLCYILDVDVIFAFFHFLHVHYSNPLPSSSL